MPGDLISDGGFRPGENTYRLHGKVYATRIGLVNYERGFVSVIALKANYAPRVGDNVIGVVVDIDLGSWSVDIGATSMAPLNVPDALGEPFKQEMVLPDFLDVGDVIVARVVDMNREGTPILSTLGPDLGMVEEGRLVKMTPSKIPRLIGKRGSMVKMILKETGCQIIIGQNGTILVNSKDREMEELVVQIIQKIESEAHTMGLTNRIYEFIEEIKERKKE